MKKLLSIAATFLVAAAAVGQTNGSRPLDVSMLLLTLQSYQQTNALGKTNGYAPLNSNALVSPQFLFPGFTNAVDGTFWVKSGSTIAPVTGLSVSTNTLSVSRVSIGQITASNPVLYGIKINNANDALVLKGGNQNRVYVATGNSLGLADSTYTNFVWSVNANGAFSFPSGTILNGLSMNSSSISNAWQIYRQNGMSINFSNRTISGYGNPISVSEYFVVPNISKSVFSTNAAAYTYALNANSADQLYARSDKTNPWSAMQAFTSITLSNPLSISNGGTGSTNQAGFRSAFGLVIGTNVQAQSAILQAIANTTNATNNSMLSWNGSVWTNRPPDAIRTNLGLVVGANVQAYSHQLQYISSQTNPATNSVLVWGSTNWTVKSADTARAALGLSIGTNVQAYSSVLASIGSYTSPPSSSFLVGNGTGWTVTGLTNTRAALWITPFVGTNSYAELRNATNNTVADTANGLRLYQELSFMGTNATQNAAITRTNLGLGNGLTTNKTIIIGSTTNVIAISNGIITSWTP